MTSNSYRKTAIRARMKAAGENYLTASRFVEEEDEKTRFGSEYWDEDLEEAMGELYASMDFFWQKWRTDSIDLGDALEDYIKGKPSPYWVFQFGEEWGAAMMKEIDRFNSDLQKLAQKFRVTKNQVDEKVQDFIKVVNWNQEMCDKYGEAVDENGDWL